MHNALMNHHRQNVFNNLKFDDHILPLYLPLIIRMSTGHLCFPQLLQCLFYTAKSNDLGNEGP